MGVKDALKKIKMANEHTITKARIKTWERCDFDKALSIFRLTFDQAKPFEKTPMQVKKNMIMEAVISIECKRVID